MATLTIGDKSVEVGDEFLRLSPEQQNAAVADIARSIGAAAPKAAEPAAPEVPVTVNRAVRAAATGVPVVGGLLNKANAAVNATLAPAVEPLLARSADDINTPVPGGMVGDVPLPPRAPTWSERFGRSEAMQNLQDRQFAEAHPYLDPALKITGGVAGSIPLMMAAPAAFGLTGTLPQMVARGAASNAALGAADAAVRGEGVVAPAAVGGIVGGAAPLVARGVGAGVRAYREARNPTPPVRQNVENIAGVDVPLTSGQVASDPLVQAEEEIMRRGGRGGSAEAIARQADEEAQRAVGDASASIARMLDPAGVSPRTAPQAAGEVVQSELAAQAAAREAAEAQAVRQVAAEGDTLARNLSGGAAPVSPFDAAESTGAAVTGARDAAVARTREAYRARDAVEGVFDDSVPDTFADNIRTRLQAGDDRLSVNAINEGIANKALKIIDDTIGRDSGLFRNAVDGPAPAPAAAPVAQAEVDATVEALRKKFGDDVANKYAEQQAATPAPQSLMEFIAAKGGLKPDPELDAIGLGTAQRVQIPGQKGFYSAVRKNGADLDRMREAAEEAGYLQGRSADETSTVADFLDAIDAELRGQKLYPRGYEGFQAKGQASKVGAREAAEREAVMAGIQRELDDAGHGGLGREVRERAASLMHEEGMGADDAVETAFRQLEQEDAAAIVRDHFPGDRAFPGDAPMPSAEPIPSTVRGPVDLKKMDEARKQLVTMFGDAKSAAIRSGDKSDMRAMAKILHEFDNVISDALAAGKFSGDAAIAKDLQDAARKSHAEYRQTFSSRGPGDEVGRKVEKILGRYGDDKASPEQILAMAYGPKSRPGTGEAVKVGLRLRNILGENSPEYARWKQGILAYVDDASLSPAARAQRFDEFLQTSWAKGLLSAPERQSIAQYSRNLRATEPRPKPASKLAKDIARIDGTDGNRPASVDEVAKMITAGTGDSQRLLGYLQTKLSPEGWARVKQSVFDDLVNAPPGHNDFTALQKSKRLSDYLGSKVAEVVNTPAERAEMAKLASVYKRMVPLPGTTNPSNTAPTLAKIARKAGDNLLALIGLTTSGVPGAIVGHVAQRAGESIKDARAGKEAIRLFFGEQARQPIRTGRVPQIAAQAVPASQR